MQPSQPPKGRILCTDADAHARKLAREILTKQGFEVVATDDLQEALNLAQMGGFDLYILDVWMPGQSGIELCRKLREFDPKTPILFYCGAARETDKELAYECGAQSFLVQPVPPNILVDEVLRLTAQA